MESAHLSPHGPSGEAEVFDPADYRPTGKGLRWAALAAGVFLLLLLAAGVVPRWRQHEVVLRDAQRAAVDLPKVRTARVVRAVGSASSAWPASIEPLQETAIYARANGYVRRWNVDIGAHVKKGQVLAELDVPDVDAELEQARAASLQAQAQIAQAKNQLGLTHVTRKRSDALGPQGVISQQEVDQAVANDDVQGANVAAAEAGYRSSQANVRRLSEVRGFSQLLAPFDGVVTQRTAEVGQLVTAGTSSGQPLFKVAEVDVVRVFVNVPQLYAAGIHAGMDAPASVRELPGHVFPGKVARTSNALDPTTRTLLVEVDIPNMDSQLLAGMYAKVSFDVQQWDPRLMVPSTSVVFDARGTRVAEVRDGAIAWRDVRIDGDYGERLAVESGVAEGDEVAVNPSDSFVDGLRVQDEELPPPPTAPPPAPSPRSAGRGLVDGRQAGAE